MPKSKYPRIFMTSDLHLTDRATDAYRFDIFDWLIKRIHHAEADYLFILGDITDSKDHHSAALINKIVKSIRRVRDETGVEVFVLKGNHDYIDVDEPYFDWLNEPGIRFITEPEEMRIAGKDCLFLPHTRQHIKDWKKVDMKTPDFILIHQTLIGSVASNGMEMPSGVPRGVFDKAKKSCHVIAGDIHVPQTLGRVTYCGAPYPITFGDSYSPRVLYFNGKEMTSVPRNTITKQTIVVAYDEDFDEVVSEKEIGDGDQIKVRLVVPAEHLESAKELKEEVYEAFTEAGAFVANIEVRTPTPQLRPEAKGTAGTEDQTPTQLLEGYAKAFDIHEDAVAVGRELLADG